MEDKITTERAGEIMQALFRELKTLGGKARAGQLEELAAPKLNLSEYEQETYKKSGSVRWRSHARFYSIDCTKAGYIEKAGGYWYLTEAGEQALSLPPGEFMRSARRKYQDWKTARGNADEVISDDDEEQVEQIIRQSIYEQAVEQARAEIEEHIHSLGPYEFQRLVGALLVAMGYHVPFIAPPGRDGGVDVIAYKDPLGTVEPRIQVQVKHRDQKVSVREVRELEGLLRRDGDIGLIVSSGGFTSEVDREIRSSAKHIETMDLNRLINLWQQYYDSVRENSKALLPLVRLHFLAPIEE